MCVMFVNYWRLYGWWFRHQKKKIIFFVKFISRVSTVILCIKETDIASFCFEQFVNYFQWPLPWLYMLKCNNEDKKNTHYGKVRYNKTKFIHWPMTIHLKLWKFNFSKLIYLDVYEIFLLIWRWSLW